VEAKPMKNGLFTIIMLLVGMSAGLAWAYDEYSQTDPWQLSPIEQFQAKQRERQKTFQGLSYLSRGYIPTRDYKDFERELREYRSIPVELRDKPEGRGRVLRYYIENATKVHPGWKKYAEKQMKSEQPIEPLGPSLERKIRANSWSTLFNQYTSRFYNWYQNRQK
jgi:hypothetical protein